MTDKPPPWRVRRLNIPGRNPDHVWEIVDPNIDQTCPHTTQACLTWRGAFDHAYRKATEISFEWWEANW